MMKIIFISAIAVFLVSACSKVKFYYENSEMQFSKYPKITDEEIITYDDSLNIYSKFTYSPIIERQFPPEYPLIAKNNNWQGIVVLDVEILSSGSVGRVILKKSSGYEILDNAAISAAKEWKYTPAQLENKPVVAWLAVGIEFRL